MMSDKRFELVESICNEVGKQQIEIMDNLKKQILDKQKIADLLNELSEEREYFTASDIAASPLPIAEYITLPLL